METPQIFFETSKELNERDNKDKKEKLKDFKEYKIKKDDSYINILIGKKRDSILIRSLFYEIRFNEADLSLLFNTNFNSLNESYEFIKNVFEKNKVIVKEILNFKMILEIEINGLKKKEKEKIIEITLLPELKNEESVIFNLISEFLELKKEVKNLKNDNKNIQEENKKLKQENTQMKNDINEMKTEINSLKNFNLINSTNCLFNNMNNMNSMNSTLPPINMIDMMSYNNDLNNFRNIDSLNNEIKKDNDKITVIFRGTVLDSKSFTPIYIDCSSDEKVSTIIERYRAKAGDNDINKKFIFNAKALNENLTIKEAALGNNSNIFVIKAKRIKDN
jgi:hypothetical protein